MSYDMEPNELIYDLGEFKLTYPKILQKYAHSSS